MMWKREMSEIVNYMEEKKDSKRAVIQPEISAEKPNRKFGKKIIIERILLHS